MTVVCIFGDEIFDLLFSKSFRFPFPFLIPSHTEYSTGNIFHKNLPFRCFNMKQFISFFCFGILAVPMLVADQVFYDIRKQEGSTESLFDGDYSDLNTLYLLDEAVDSLRLPFDFPFFGELYNRAYVSSNGILSFSMSRSTAVVDEVYSNRIKPDHGMDSGANYNDNQLDSYIAVAKQSSEHSHFTSLLSDIDRRHNSQHFPTFRAHVRDVHHNLRMIHLESPSTEAIAYLRAHEHVHSLSRDHRVSAFLGGGPVLSTAGAYAAAEQNDSSGAEQYSWGLDRIDQSSLPLDGTRYAPSAASGGGEGVRVFVVDTGLDTLHEEFSGGAQEREVANVFNYYGDVSADTDDNGHGTHCAGTIGGVRVGVAPKASLLGVKVLDGQGAGTVGSILAGLEHIAGLRTGDSDGAMVVSMSLGGFCGAECDISALNMAVDELSARGVTVVVAAGNTEDDACQYTPASAASVITVGAVTPHDELAPFSSMGSCVDILAPGQSILSACPSRVQESSCANSHYQTLSGTSMAAPHVAGVLSLWLSQTRPEESASLPQHLKLALQCSAVEGVVTLPDSRTANLLLQTPPVDVEALDEAVCDTAADCPVTETGADMCSGHGYCFFGSCRCDAHWAGDDCSSYSPLWLADPFCCDGGDLSDPTAGPFASIALLWTDLNPEQSRLGAVHFGPVDDDKFAVVFNSIVAYGFGSCKTTIEVVLDQSGDFELAMVDNHIGVDCGTRKVSVGVRGSATETSGSLQFEQLYGPSSRNIPAAAHITFALRSVDQLAHQLLRTVQNTTDSIAPPASLSLDASASCQVVQVQMQDSWGDGWNGNALHFGAEDEVSLESGSEGLATVCLPPGSYNLYACGGAWWNEVSWEIVGHALQGGAHPDITCLFASLDNSKVLVIEDGSQETTVQPSANPSIAPTVQPSANPSIAPTVQPSANPSIAPTAQPSANPSIAPTAQSSLFPTPVESQEVTANPGEDTTGVGCSINISDILERQEKMLDLIAVLREQQQQVLSEGMTGGGKYGTNAVQPEQDKQKGWSLGSILIASFSLLGIVTLAVLIVIVVAAVYAKFNGHKEPELMLLSLHRLQKPPSPPAGPTTTTTTMSPLSVPDQGQNSDDSGEPHGKREIDLGGFLAPTFLDDEDEEDEYSY